MGALEIVRADVEDFLYEEAALLDAWELERWLELFEAGGRYQVPTGDCPDGDPALVQTYVNDDWVLLQSRVARLLSRNAHAENPRSRTHRMVTNVRLARADGDDECWRVRANFSLHRMRDARIDPYLGSYDHLLVMTDGGLRFRIRRAALTAQRLQPAGRLSFIL